MHASGGGRIPEPPKVAAVTTEAQQRRRAVLILYCTLTLSHYALLGKLLLVTVMSVERIRVLDLRKALETYFYVYMHNVQSF